MTELANVLQLLTHNPRSDSPDMTAHLRFLALALTACVPLLSFAQPDLKQVLPALPDGYELSVDTLVAHESGELAGYTTYRLFVECLHPLDFVVSCSGDESNPLLLASTSSEGWYNSALAAGWNAVAINELFFTAFPEMEFDSFLTIGADNSSYPSSMHPISVWGAIDAGLEFDQDGPGTNVLVNDEVGGTWFQTVPLTLDDSLTHPAFAGPAQRVLLAQITTPGRLYGQIQLQIFGEGLNVNEFMEVLLIPFEGCLNPEACNFSPYATMDDGSCAESDPCGVCGGSGFFGCTDTEACNYIAEACGDDGSCEFTSCMGCTDSSACNYEYAATVDSGTCIYPDCAGNCFNDPCACCCPGDCNYPDCLAWENDGDGICDQICCDCVGVYDECGVCNGPGAILECGCSSVPEGACDCQGNQLDAVGICGGNCLLDNDNNGICDDEEIYGCTYPLATNFDALASRDDGSCVFPCVGDINQNIFDWDANGNIGIADFLMMLSVFGDVDVDGDGVWDSQDDCVDLEACNFANDPTEACQYLDILGVCGGGCDVDSDGDGICDDTDTCVGVLDECGVCNGPGPTNIIVEAITVFYDSLYLPLDEEWFVYAVDADTTFAFECPPTTDGCSDPSEEIPPYSLVVEASEPVNPANGTVYRFYVTAADSTDTFSAVYGNDNDPFHIQTPEGIYNSELNSSWNASGINATILSFFPEVQDDSFGTIGLDLGSVFPGGEPPGLQQDPDMSPSITEYFTQGGTEVFVNTIAGMIWFVYANNGVAPNSLPVNGRWLIAQITTTGSISGQINVQIFPQGVGADQLQKTFVFDGCGTFY